MVTKYDVFEIIYRNRSAMKPVEVVRKLNKDEKEYHVVHRYLRKLVNEKLLEKTKNGFQAENSARSELLYNMIYYCVRNGINYNFILDKNFVKFISKSLQKQEITSKTGKINPRTIKKYLKILDKYGLILIISEKPLKAKIFYNVLLNNLLVYFGYDALVLTESPIDYIKAIQKELVIHKRLKRKNEARYQNIINGFEISFIYHSLSLEGNPITLPDTIKILKDNLIPANMRTVDVDEIKDYRQAIFQMLKDVNEKKLLNLQMALNYHKIAMNHKSEIAGKIRTVNVFIKGNLDFKVSSPKKIKPGLDKLFDTYNEFAKKKNKSLNEILDFVVYFHNEFQHIHPFEDGNSRITRLITFHLLQAFAIPVFDIPFGLLDEYLDSTKGSKKREDEKLHQNFQKIILFNLKKINEKLNE